MEDLHLNLQYDEEADTFIQKGVPHTRHYPQPLAQLSHRKNEGWIRQHTAAMATLHAVPLRYPAPYRITNAPPHLQSLWIKAVNGMIYLFPLAREYHRHLNGWDIPSDYNACPCGYGGEETILHLLYCDIHKMEQSETQNQHQIGKGINAYEEIYAQLSEDSKPINPPGAPDPLREALFKDGEVARIMSAVLSESMWTTLLEHTWHPERTAKRILH